jgi:class 3 adenylate cyclase
LKIYKDIDNKFGIASSYNNIGLVYDSQGNLSEALKYHLASLKIREAIGDKYGIASSYNNIGTIYSDQGNYPEALKNLFAGLKIFEAIGDKDGTANSYNNIGEINIKLKKINEAEKYLNKGLQLSKEIGSKEVIKNSEHDLSKLDSIEGNFRQAYEHYKLYIIYKDSLNNEVVRKKTIQQSMTYEFEKKEAAAKAWQDKKDAVAEAESKREKVIRYSVIGGFLLALVFLFFVNRSLRVTLRQNRLIKKQKKLVDEKNLQLSQQNEEISNQRDEIDLEKKKSDNLLLNILPAEVAEELKAKGKTDVKTYSMVTVMFTDFKDFTSVSENISAELLVAEIDYCFSAFDNIIQKYRIEKIKTIGDAYLCAGGLPVLNNTHSEEMINAAIEIRDFMLLRKKEKESKGEIAFEMRIGIHTGPVVAGIVGVKKFAYDIWGDTVNIAARIESSCETGKVNISGSTYKLVKDKFNCTYRGKIQAKNKGEIDMYFVETKAAPI